MQCLMTVAAMLVLQGEALASLQCYDCHGTRTSQDIRPEDTTYRNPSSGGFQGNHRTHMSPAATVNACAECHPGSVGFLPSHRNGLIKVSSKINASPSTSPTTYRNSTSAFPQTTNPNLSSAACSNVNCHFEKLTPNWSSNPSTTVCTTCHGAPPTDGHHPGKLVNSLDKHGAYLGMTTTSCNQCHTDHTGSFTHATSAGNRALVVRFLPYSTAVRKYGAGIYGGHSSSTGYPAYLPSQNPARNGTCTNLYCHSDGRGGPASMIPRWSDTRTTQCFSCHKGKTSDETSANCITIGGTWTTVQSPIPGGGTIGVCRPYLTMSSNGHHRLVGPQWVRKYPCYYCHNATAATDGTISSMSMHVNGKPDVVMAPLWNMANRSSARYNAATKTCDNVYCHSDGTSDPDAVRPFAWNAGKTECNTCHGHPTGSCAGCHDGKKRFLINNVSTILTVLSGWQAGQEWKAAMPMIANQGPGTARANSHPRHAQTNFSCDECHATTVLSSTCTTCHVAGIPPGGMGEVSHINATYHVNKTKDVAFKRGGTYNPINKTCSGTGGGTTCHVGTVPQWGGSNTDAVVCLNCHGAATDVDSFSFKNFSAPAKISQAEWAFSGHGRMSSAGRYPVSNNPAANFGGNPCWYCHDPKVLHNYSGNPFRLRQHSQFTNRFAKECVYCHMTGTITECLSCHNTVESLAPQLANISTARLVTWPNRTTTVWRQDHRSYGASSCLTDLGSTNKCHNSDAWIHNTGPNTIGAWTADQKVDIQRQYMMMGVCLQCHDDDSGGQCTSCHTPPAGNPLKYSIGYNPGLAGTRFIKPKQARASGGHFGYKHYLDYKQTGVWKGGKFCWDCHDPHGDADGVTTKNIYMIQSQVGTSTDGRFGKPVTRAAVVFTRKASGKDYANSDSTKPYNGICNVCHSPASKHFTSTSGDKHNESRVCTTCHEHRFSSSHGDKQPCNTCHKNRPIPKHSAFGLPRDCTKCHAGIIGSRMDIMTQLNSNSHHIQGVPTTNTHCYQCHWESTNEGLINIQYHEGYNYKLYTSIKNAKSDLVIWGPGQKPTVGQRPTVYRTTSSASGRATAVQFIANNIGTVNERAEAAKVTNHCLGCHSDQNNDSQPFNDCKTPGQYAWDFKSIAARYNQTGTTTWGKYGTNGKSTVTKAFSAHGNAAPNQGGWNTATGIDSAISNRRGNTGIKNVQCYDCHSSHGSSLVGTTSSYTTFNGTHNGANLKETQAGKGGYSMSYRAQANTSGVNPYNAGAAQCFDCHSSRTSGTTPWGYNSTFGVLSSIMGYKDTAKFGQGMKASTGRFTERASRANILGGHMKASSFLNRSTSALNRINGLCTPCHDPHGVTPTLGGNQAYAVPLLKGTWMTSPYKEDAPPLDPTGSTARKAPYGVSTPVTGDYLSWGDGIWHQNHPVNQPATRHNIDHNTLGGSSRIQEDDTKFAGLCLRCHNKERILGSYAFGTATSANKAPWKSVKRIHAATKGWGANKEHSFTCSKCHQPHNSGLPRLMQTNCLDYKHRGGRASNGLPWAADKQVPYSAHDPGSEHRGYPIGSLYGVRYTSPEATTACHVGRSDLSPPLPAYSPGTIPSAWPDGNLWNLKTPW
jgi:predicted CxxxxCH...CXXCH cytochrome family protein